MSFLDNITHPEFWISQPWMLLMFAFQIWMCVDAVRREEWIWAIFIFIGMGLSAILYYIFVYRQSGGGGSSAGFELPGAGTRARIKELEASKNDPVWDNKASNAT